MVLLTFNHAGGTLRGRVVGSFLTEAAQRSHREASRFRHIPSIQNMRIRNDLRCLSSQKGGNEARR